MRTLGLRRRAAVLLFVCIGPSWAVTGCSLQQGYASAQTWQRNQCLKIVDVRERLRCMKEADQPYDSYQKEAEAIKAQP